MLASKENYEKLNRFISQLSEDELQTPFDFSRDPKKKEAHWKRDKNLRDVLIHLYEWQQLLLTWVHSNQEGNERPFLTESYNWKTYGEMNVAFWKKHQKTSLEEATRLLEQSHREVLELIEVFSNDELFTKGSISGREGQVWVPTLLVAPPVIINGLAKNSKLIGRIVRDRWTV